MRYRLRTLLIVLAVGPMMVARQDRFKINVNRHPCSVRSNKAARFDVRNRRARLLAGRRRIRRPNCGGERCHSSNDCWPALCRFSFGSDYPRNNSSGRLL